VNKFIQFDHSELISIEEIINIKLHMQKESKRFKLQLKPNIVFKLKDGTKRVHIFDCNEDKDDEVSVFLGIFDFIQDSEERIMSLV